MKPGKIVLLVLMMFVQNMVFPIWYNTASTYLRTLPGGESLVPFCVALMGVGLLVAPVFCMVADRFMDSGRVLALCNLAAAGFLAGAFFTTQAAALLALLFGATVFLMPTWSIVPAITMAHVPARTFPFIRASGSLGWAASAVFSVVGIRCFGLGNFDSSPWIFASAAAVALIAAALALAMPPTPPKAKGTRMNIADALGLRAFALLGDRAFCVLCAVLLLAMVPFQWYMGYTAIYLKEADFQYLNLTQNLGQVAELAFLFLLPLLFRFCSFKKTMLVGFAALVFRYACFYAAARTGNHALDFGGILVHGLIFGVLVVAVQVHAAEIAPPELRNQAQGVVMFLTGGAGLFLSVGVFELILRANELPAGADGVARHDWRGPYLAALALSVLALALFHVCYRESSRRPRAST